MLLEKLFIVILVLTGKLHQVLNVLLFLILDLSTPLTTIHCISERLLVSGDESGVIKVSNSSFLLNIVFFVIDLGHSHIKGCW